MQQNEPGYSPHFHLRKENSLSDGQSSVTRCDVRRFIRKSTARRGSNSSKIESPTVFYGHLKKIAT
jgi:hypothetical protein